MITRPLELASRLRPAPRNLDALFFVNIGLIVLGFDLLGSRFVLAPGLGIEFQLPVLPGARAAATQTTHRITVKPSGLIINNDGPVDKLRLNQWFADEAKKTRRPSLLIIASRAVPGGDLVEIANAALAAGFEKVQVAAEEPSAPPTEGR